ncbi:hypothetical protein LptCag_0859 [Leptospirillum ferriphilum]|uniref:Uncharacterized protein n=2 Tax=Leptospirillum TaxID=179 RepID=A0A094X363_9BACT|nr:MAG: Hypothetical protein CGL2_11212113 [Leptospirillum sp. Group II '5-way CG']KGA92999.1 hypothetical protein LptCag_0859 [Leptospirillum ferriphilum]
MLLRKTRPVDVSGAFSNPWQGIANLRRNRDDYEKILSVGKRPDHRSPFKRARNEKQILS